MNCGKVYDDEAEELIEGCECGSTLFLYQQDDDGSEGDVEKDEVMEEVDDFLRSVKHGEPSEAPVEFEMESITVEEEGVYEINLKKLLDRVPLIVEVKNSRYYLHLPSAFRQGEEKNLSMKDLAEAEKG
jgi:predicted  nucleic acid-binding Zn-ribbon protein